MTECPRISTELPWKIRIIMFILSFVADAFCRHHLTFNRRFFNLIDTKYPLSKKPKNGVTTSDILVDASRNLWFRIFTPVDTRPTASLPFIVYFHGGGFVLMSADSISYDDYCRRLAREIHAVVISVNYRLAPEHRYPSQYQDGFDVLKFIDSSKTELFPASADLQRCFLAGDSAGANLVHNVAVLSNEHKFYNLKLAGIISIQPFFGGEERTESEIRLSGVSIVTTERTDWIWKAFLPEGSNRDHPAVNVFGPNAVDISGINFPATIVFVGGFDPLKDWQKLYYEGLKKYGKEAYLVEYSNAVHGFYLIPELIEFSSFIKEVKQFIRFEHCK